MTNEYGTDERGTADSGTSGHEASNSGISDGTTETGAGDDGTGEPSHYPNEPYGGSYDNRSAAPAYGAVAPGAVPPPPQQFGAQYSPPMPVGYMQPGTLLESGQLPMGVTLAGPGIRLGSFLLSYLLVQLTLYIGWVIWAIIISGKGQTPGKQVLNLRVIDKNTLQPVGFASLFFMRGIVGGLVAAILVPLTLGIILFMPLWDSKNQNIWDKVSGTYVVSDPFNAWAL